MITSLLLNLRKTEKVMHIPFDFFGAGPNLPKKLYGHAVIGLDNDMIVLGGNSGFWYEKAIYRLSCANADCTWTTMKQALKVRRQYFVAIPMNNSQVTCVSLIED